MEKFDSQKPMDMELVMFWISHIEEPCEDLHGNNVRSTYIREAKMLLPKLTNPFAKEMLENVINKYEQSLKTIVINSFYKYRCPTPGKSHLSIVL